MPGRSRRLFKFSIPARQDFFQEEQFSYVADLIFEIIVRGDVDLHTASTLDRQIAVESRSGIAPLTIDLSGVTHLGSAGVSALAAARDRARRQGVDCVLVAPPGSPAHHVLSLVQIPFVGGDAENVFAKE